MKRRNAPPGPGLGRDERGAVAILMGVLLTVLVSFMGLGVEVGLWWFEKSKAQSAADAAAYAAGLEMIRLEVNGALSDSEETAVAGVALAAAGDHGYDSGVTITPDGAAATVMVDVQTTLQPLLLGMVLGGDSIAIGSRATVLAQKSTKNVCVLAIDELASPGLDATGNSSASIKGCGVHSNSKSTGNQGSLCVGNNADMVTDYEVSTSGTFCTSGGNPDNVRDFDGNPIGVTENAPELNDPYGDVTADAPESCTSNQNNYSVEESDDLVDGGYYCKGLKFQDAVNLNPGTYYVSGGIDFTASANVSGSGVTFVLMEGATVSINGSAQLDLGAPNSGDYAGLLFFQDPDTAGNNPQSSSFNGNANVSLNGALYFPASEVRMNGSFSTDPNCMQVIAGKVDLAGSQDLNITHDESCAGMTKKPFTRKLALIG